MSEPEYKRTLTNMDKETLVNFNTWVKRIIGTQKKNHPYEDILLEELKSKITNVHP